MISKIILFIRSSVSYQIMKKVAHGGESKLADSGSNQFAPHVNVQETDVHVKKAAKTNQVCICPIKI